MQNIGEALDRVRIASKSYSSNSAIAAGQDNPVTTKNSAGSPAVSEEAAGCKNTSGRGGELDHIGAIQQVFNHMKLAYHRQFYLAFPNENGEVLAMRYWSSSLEDYTPQLIVEAARTLVRSQKFLPSLAELIEACEKGFDLFGLPDKRTAYFEACSASSPKKNFQWSHPAVYLAGNAAGWHLLATESQKRTQPIFDHHYQIFCRRVMRGEPLEGVSPEPLPAKTNPPLSPEELSSRFAKMRDELGL